MASATQIASQAKEFIQKGYIHIQDVGDSVRAFELASQLVTLYEERDTCSWRKFYTGEKRTEVNHVPSVEIVESYQGFHFDTGQVLFPTKDQDVICFTLLYGKTHSNSNTRVIPVAKALGVTFGASIAQLEDRLLKYGNEYGSGWDNNDNIYRFSSFSRLVDAMGSEPRLTNFKAIAKEKWFECSHFGNEFANNAEELSFFIERGIDVEALTERVRIGKNGLLLIDNLKCIHSRDGIRQSGELIQFLISKPAVSAPGVFNYRKWLLSHFIHNSANEPVQRSKSCI